jgi:hypothetical protein
MSDYGAEFVEFMIAHLYRKMTVETDRQAQREAFARMAYWVKQRPASTVARMETERALA